MPNYLPFKPHFALRNPHLQTIASYYLGNYKELSSKTSLIQLPDQDQVAVEISTPDRWTYKDRSVLMLHGVGGSHKSPYLARIGQKLLDRNIRVLRLNFRGVASGEGLSSHISHGGSSQDLHHVIESLQNSAPLSPLSVIGFSLGGNILLKLISEKDLSNSLDKVIAICPAVNLAKSSQMIEKWQNRLYQNSILKSLVRTVQSPQNRFSFQPEYSLSLCKTIREFDEVFTAPAAGFKSAKDYYTQSSCIHRLHLITQPCHLLFSQDDPLVDAKEVQELRLPPNLNLGITQRGGHMGYIQRSTQSAYWLDEIIFKWLC